MAGFYCDELLPSYPAPGAPFQVGHVGVAVVRRPNAPRAGWSEEDLACSEGAEERESACTHLAATCHLPRGG